MTTDLGNQLEQGLAGLGLNVSKPQRQQLLDYLGLLDHWNRTINLTGLSAPERLRRLVLEPIWVAAQLAPGGHYIDIGSGNGSPAIPWMTTGTFASTTLIESRGRRAVFLEVAARKLGLQSMTVHAARFEAVRSLLAPASWVTLQGIRLDVELLNNIRGLSPSVRVVWLTRNPKLPERPALRLEIPDSDREAVVFGPETDPS